MKLLNLKIIVIIQCSLATLYNNKTKQIDVLLLKI